MDYSVEELMPVMAKLADKYTSKESSSVTYDTARKLMGAILYCIHECVSYDSTLLLKGALPDCMTAYEEGYRAVLEKVNAAKEVYHRIVDGFEDFGCRNYRDTIIKGMPAFFMKYDARFEPQNHLLTIDYPVLCIDNSRTGIDFIKDYLEETEYEQQFLKHFSESGVANLLEKLCTDYRGLYFDNICAPVLMRAAACLAADKEIYLLELSNEEYEEARDYFTAAQTEKHLSVMLDILEKNIMKKDYKGIFSQCAHDFSVRVNNGISF